MRFLIPALLMSLSVAAQTRPNIIFIMSDDHDADAISAYNKELIHTPGIDRLAKEGMMFKRAFVGNAICAPARATLLTGQHSHKNGMRDNRDTFDSSKTTFPKLLRSQGYQTAVVGKWHLKSYPAGFDFWKVLPGQGLYFDPRIISMNGDTSTLKGYATDVITDDAIAWMKQRDANKPFALLLHHKAPHRNFFPPLKYIELYSQKKVPVPKTLLVDTANRGSAWRLHTMSIARDMKLCSDLKVDPEILKKIPGMEPTKDEVLYYNSTFKRIPDADRKRIKEIYAERGRIMLEQRPTGEALLQWKYQWYMQDYLACVASIDENVARTLAYIDEAGLTSNTIVVYTSDQGFYLGENGWFDKRWMYDVSMQSPLLIRWPGRIKAGSISNALVQNIDYAPTFLAATGLAVPAWMQGESLMPILTQRKNTTDRKGLYYHFYEYNADHTVLQHIGIRTDRYKLIYFYTVDEWELFDLKNDPEELHNLASSTAHQAIFTQLKKDLASVRRTYDDLEPAGKFSDIKY